MMITRYTVLLVFLVFLVACGEGGSALNPAREPTSPADVARAFVTALGEWNEPTVRQLIIPNATTEMMLAAEGSQWRGWATYPLGPQTSVEVTESVVNEDRATVVVRSLHQQGESGVRLVLMQVDGDWKVESWQSYRP